LQTTAQYESKQNAWENNRKGMKHLLIAY